LGDVIYERPLLRNNETKRGGGSLYNKLTCKLYTGYADNKMGIVGSHPLLV
jgi:hypothetical protein